MPYEIKCRKCRKLISQDAPNEIKLLNAHGAALHDIRTHCPSLNGKNLIFLSEDFLPEWIIKKIQEAQWTKGRLNCPQCDSRLGAFDFVSGNKCDCNQHILPSVHVINSKIDLCPYLSF